MECQNLILNRRILYIKKNVPSKVDIDFFFFTFNPPPPLHESIFGNICLKDFICINVHVLFSDRFANKKGRSIWSVVFCTSIFEVD